jgi:hypothetical protein
MNFLVYEENFVFFFISVDLRLHCTIRGMQADKHIIPKESQLSIGFKYEN